MRCHTKQPTITASTSAPCLPGRHERSTPPAEVQTHSLTFSSMSRTWMTMAQQTRSRQSSRPCGSEMTVSQMRSTSGSSNSWLNSSVIHRNA
eukprot:359786-Chlamydomonas_euryale.AAC.7